MYIYTSIVILGLQDCTIRSVEESASYFCRTHIISGNKMSHLEAFRENVGLHFKAYNNLNISSWYI